MVDRYGSFAEMAAEMQRRAPGAWIAAAHAEMTRPQGTASAILAEARAMTDVTGFGLAGHLLNICEASGCAARMSLVPGLFMTGAQDLAKAGIRSTLYPQNRAQAPYLPGLADPGDRARVDLLFDPQTAGGLLAAIAPERAGKVLADLLAAGYPAIRLGSLIEGNPRLSLGPSSL